MQTTLGDFDDIRSYEDEEVNQVFQYLTQEPSFLRLIRFLYPDTDPASFIKKLLSLDSISAFQTEIIRPYIKERIIDTTCSQVSITGLKKLGRDKAYLFVSNHRDIILDSAFLNTLLSFQQFECTEIAIGDNLLIHPWITALVKLNRSFIVKRNAPIRQMFEHSRTLSNYIRHKITQKNRSVWIAQRQGRSKDGDDRTQEALIKMFQLSHPSSALFESLKDLSIVPLSISYEYDPCDHLKAREFLLKKLNPDFKKSKEDDLESMATGMKGYKGEVYFKVGKPLHEALKKVDFIGNRNEKIKALARLIDQKIHKNYKIYPNNYIATDLLNNNLVFANHYTLQQKKNFQDYLTKKIKMIDIHHLDPLFLKKSFLEMYAFPLKNHLAAI